MAAGVGGGGGGGGGVREMGEGGQKTQTVSYGVGNVWGRNVQRGEYS